MMVSIKITTSGVIFWIAALKMLNLSVWTLFALQTSSFLCPFPLQRNVKSGHVWNYKMDDLSLSNNIETSHLVQLKESY
jgi:hypothetical protein